MSVVSKSKINMYINYLAIVFAFGLGLAKFLVPISGALIIILWLIEGDFKRKIDFIVRHKSLVLFLVFIFYLFLTLYISANIDYYNTPRPFWAGKHITPIFYYFKHYFFYTLVLLALVTSLKREFVRYVLGAFILGMLVNEVTSYLIFFGVIKPLHYHFNQPTIVPFFINHSYYSFFLVIAIFLMIIELKRFQLPIFIKVIFGFFLITATLNLMINTGRIGQFSFFIIAIIAFIYFFKPKLKTIIGAFLVISVLFLVFYNISTPFKNRIDKTLNSFDYLVKTKDLVRKRSSLSNRLVMDIIGLNIAKEYPLFGVGIDEAMNAKNKIINTKLTRFKFEKNVLHFHNNYIQYLVEGGIVGLVLFLAFIVSVFTEKSNFVGRDIQVILIPAFLLMSLTEVPFLRDRTFALFILLYAIILIYSHSSNDYETNNIGRDEV